MEREYSYDYYLSSCSSEEEEDDYAPVMMRRNESASFQRAMSSKPRDSKRSASLSASKKFQGPPAPKASKAPPQNPRPLGPQQGPQVHPDSFDSFEAAMKAAEDNARMEKAEESSNVS